jgi:hypothetical protein
MNNGNPNLCAIGKKKFPKKYVFFFILGFLFFWIFIACILWAYDESFKIRHEQSCFYFNYSNFSIYKAVDEVLDRVDSNANISGIRDYNG